MKIVLLRHGKPDQNNLEKIKAKQLGEWIKQYNSAPLDLTYQPKKEALTLIQNTNKIICSHLSRSTDSAKTLGVTQIHNINSHFNEAELPYFNIPFLKLLPETWAVIFRILWFCGLTKNSESLIEAKLRASVAANQLIEIANNHDSVAFIGHGFMNRFIAKELLADNWHCSTQLSKKHWGFGVYEYFE